MPMIDPEDYPQTSRGYRYPPAGGVNVANNVPFDVGRLAHDVNADVDSVAAAESAIADDLAAHEAATTDVHGIADTSALVVTGDPRLGDARTPLPHAASHATGGSDPISPESIGAATVNRVTFGDAEFTVPAWARYVGHVGGITANRRVILPPASSVPAGTALVVADEHGVPSGGWSIIMRPSAGDRIAGALYERALIGAYAVATLTSNGVDLWSMDNERVVNVTSTRGDMLVRGAVGLSRHPVGTPGQFLRADPVAPRAVAWQTVGASDVGADPAGSAEAARVAAEAASAPRVHTHQPADIVGAAVGANGSLLVADSAASTGVAWRAPSPITASAIGVTLDRANPVYRFTGGSVTATLPAANTHAGVRFLIRNAGSGTVTVSGITGLTIPGAGYVDVASDGTAWEVFEGAYAASAVGLASYRWNQVTSAWRLLAYDTGWREVTADAPYLLLDPNARLILRRTGTRVTLSFARGSAATSAAGVALYTLPTGWRISPAIPGPVANLAVGILYNFGSGAISTAQMMTGTHTGGAVFLVGAAAAIDLRGQIIFDTSDTLPTSLPGTQVTAPV